MLQINEAADYLAEKHNVDVKTRSNLWGMMRTHKLEPVKVTGMRGLAATAEMLDKFAAVYTPAQKGFNDPGVDLGKAATTAEWNLLCAKAETAVQARRAYIVKRCRQTGERAFDVATDCWQRYGGNWRAMEAKR